MLNVDRLTAQLLRFYQKCGVMLLDPTPQNLMQKNLFITKDYERAERLMDVIDQLSSGFGQNSVFLAVQGGETLAAAS